MQLKVLLLLLCVAVCGWTWAEEPEKYAMVEIEVSDDNISTLQQLGLPLDCCGCEIGERSRTFVVPVNKSDMELLKQQRATFKVIVEDAAEFYAQRSRTDRSEVVAPRATQMPLGSVGGFYNVNELNQALDKLYTTYGSQNLVTQRASIGKTYENRDMVMVKISDNASTDESGVEPQVLYTAMHHAREPAGMMTVVYFMYYLLENYETDARVKSLVNSRELYFVPMINVDGYVYNYTNSPNGGGMWRKNRKGPGTDLNRNYGPDDLWNYPNNGSSTYTGSDTYRGPSAFSEPETQVIRNFVSGKKFRATLNYHTYSNLLIYPYGIRNELAHPMFKTMAMEMTKKNGYSYGTAEGLLYAVRGVSDDWFYKEDASKNVVFAMTPEVGGSSDGFWPLKSRIFPLAEENLEANILLGEYASQLATK